MLSWPELETRVTVRYRRPAGSVPPLTDAVGHLLQIEPMVRIRTKVGAVVEIASADVVVVRTLTDAPVRTAQIRALEHAAAMACPGTEHRWLDGWFLRAAHTAPHEAPFDANSAVPLDISANAEAVPAIADWYVQRGLSPLLALPDRLLRVPGAVQRSHRMLVRDVTATEPTEIVASVELASRPNDAWVKLQGGQLPVDVATAVLDGEVCFGGYPGKAAARAAVTDAPDQTRWVGVSALRLSDTPAALHAARDLCAALLAWGAQRGASRAYVRVPDEVDELEDEATAGHLAGSM